MSKTNTGLVSYVKAMIGCPYWYGCFGQTASESLYRQKKKQYPKYYEWGYSKSVAGKKVFDCVGLIKGYLWSESINGNPVYHASQDVSADGMLNKCNIKGKIHTIPNVSGILVFKKGHVGVLIGNGKVVEAKGHAYGVIQSNLKEGKWTDWGYCPWIKYTENITNERKSDNVQYFKKCSSDERSIVDGLCSIGEKATYEYRKKIADRNGINHYKGTATQNIAMLKLLKSGKLIKP